MAAYRDFLPNAPEELGIFVGLKTVPSMDPFPQEAWGKRACAIIGAFNGSEEDGKKALAPLLDKLPEPFFNWMGTMPFPAMQGLFDAFFPKGLQWYWKGDFVTDLPDEAIEVYIAESAKAPSELCLMHLYPIDGAVRRVGKDETAWSARDATWSMVIAGIDPDPQKAEALKRWGRGYWDAVHQLQPGRRLRELHDGRRRRGARAGELWRQLRAARGGEEAVRSGQPVPREPEHQAGGLTCSTRRGGRWHKSTVMNLLDRLGLREAGPQDLPFLFLVDRPNGRQHGRQPERDRASA